MQQLRRITLAAMAVLFMPSAMADGRVVGSYVGILPCADCPAMDVRLDVFEDGSFHQRSVYRERERSFDRVGRWARVDGVLELRYGHGELRRFTFGNGWMTMLDTDGKPIRSQLNYTLNRSSLLSRIEPEVTLDGNFTYMADSAQLEDCATGRRMPVAMEGEYLRLEQAWSRSGSTMQRPLPVRVEARIVERVNMEGPRRHTVIVERVVQTGTPVSCTPVVRAAPPKPLPQPQAIPAPKEPPAPPSERVQRTFQPGVPVTAPAEVTPVVSSPAPPQRVVQTFETVSPEPAAAPVAAPSASPAPLPPIALPAAAVAAQAPAVKPAPAAPLHGTQWRLVRLGGSDLAPMPGDRRPYLMFAPSESPRVSGFTGCNRFTGGTTMFGGSILFGGIAATKMACLDSTDIERDFLDALDKARSWRITGNHFELSDGDGRLIARFVAGG